MTHIEEVRKPVAWRYEIKYGPDGEANYAWLYRGDEMVATMRTHHAVFLSSTPSALAEKDKRIAELEDGIKRLSDEEELCDETTGDDPFSIVRLAAKLAACEARSREIMSSLSNVVLIGDVGHYVNDAVFDELTERANRAEAAEARAEAAERQLSEIAGHMDSECDSDSILHGIREAEADRNIYKDRATSAESEAARLRAILAEARKVVEPFADKVRMADDRAVNGGYAPSFDVYECNWVFTFGHLRAASALAEKLEKETGNG